jgi:glycosyltransferase involved in cell wall biosynthesis
VTVHDVAFVHHPERFSRRGVRVMRRGLERCRRSDLVMCPSTSAATDLVRLGFDPDRIRVVPWGVEVVEVTDDDRQRVRASYRLPDEFVLFVGTFEPRKNLAGLAAAMRQVPDLPLVVAGAAGWGDALAQVDATVLGFVPDRDLRPLMSAATVFAYPSLEEGFGLPVLEAMAQGTPVVTSRGTSTEEVAGGAAVLADPTDPTSIAEAVRAAAGDRQRWGAAGLERARGCTWDATVDAVVAAYREVAR